MKTLMISVKYKVDYKPVTKAIKLANQLEKTIDRILEKQKKLKK